MPLNNSYDEQEVIKAIATALETFYANLIEKIDGLNIKKVMKRKNPYLYRAKAMQSASEIVESVLTAFVSSSEETIFGNCFFEPIAIAASGGNKALAEGIDIMIQDKTTNTISAIAVKSGPSVFNADSKKRQEQNFMAASKLAQQAKARYEAYIGYCYGKKKDSGRGKPKMYQELAGKRFWAELTGDEDFYIKIIGYMGTMPEKYVANYKESYNKAANRLVREFSNSFCKEDGSIDPELFTAIDSQKKSALTCFYHDISEEKLKPLSTKGRKNPLGYQLACFWDCQSSPVTGFIYSS